MWAEVNHMYGRIASGHNYFKVKVLNVFINTILFTDIWKCGDRCGLLVSASASRANDPSKNGRDKCSVNEIIVWPGLGTCICAVNVPWHSRHSKNVSRWLYVFLSWQSLPAALQPSSSFENMWIRQFLATLASVADPLTANSS